MNRATKNAKVDLKAKCDELYAEFYNAGMRYIIALDERIEAEKKESKSPQDLAVLRERKRLLESYLHRLFPDEFADTNTLAE